VEKLPISGAQREELELQAAALRPRYLKVWHNILSTFLGWSAAQVDGWATKWQSGLDNTKYSGLFYHEEASWYVVPLLIPEALRQRLPSSEHHKLMYKIEAAIVHGKSPIAFAENYDWKAARDRVEAILNEYGSSLAMVGKLTEPDTRLAEDSQGENKIPSSQ
jgi:hypothetical protein